MSQKGSDLPTAQSRALLEPELQPIHWMISQNSIIGKTSLVAVLGGVQAAIPGSGERRARNVDGCRMGDLIPFAAADSWPLFEVDGRHGFDAPLGSLIPNSL